MSALDLSGVQPLATEEDAKSELSLVMQVVKRESSITTVRAVRVNSDQLRYSIRKQVNTQLDGMVGASPRLLERMRQDSNVRDYIPQISGGAKAEADQSEQSTPITKEEALKQRRRDKRRRKRERKKKQQGKGTPSKCNEKVSYVCRYRKALADFILSAPNRQLRNACQLKLKKARPLPMIGHWN